MSSFGLYAINLAGKEREGEWESVCVFLCVGVGVCFIPGNFYLAIILAVLWHALWQSGWNILVRQARVALISQMISSHILVNGNWFFIMASAKLFCHTRRTKKSPTKLLLFQLTTFTIGTKGEHFFTFKITLQEKVVRWRGWRPVLGEVVFFRQMYFTQNIFSWKAFRAGKDHIYHHVIAVLFWKYHSEWYVLIILHHSLISWLPL